MSDLTAREATTRDGEPIVELVEEGRAVGYIYVDEAVLYTEFLPDADGESWAFEVSDLQTALDTVQTFGGYGFTTEYGVERVLRDAVGGRLYSGTNEMQKNIIARWMGL